MDPVLAGVYRRGYSIRRQRVVRRLAAGALSLQLLVALPFAFRQGDDAGGRNVRVVAPAGQDETTTTTIIELPIAVEAAEEPTTTTVAPAASPSTTAVRLGAVYGRIGAGEGGTGRATLDDQRGHTWEQQADSYGNYRFVDVTPGRYVILLWAESAAAPCTPEGTCIGTAVAFSGNEPFDVHPGEEVRRDFDMYGPTQPATTTTTLVPTSTTSTTAVAG
jgi:hypothetical protein